ncbi:hypothetical protein BJ508DRAFT_362084 [Ascobolus immersus RN42]|uniref:Uncharacterized protein n=1 Tax=Ascobolus immersus RN42 TaxID=1160509 RepID=A0A3N4I9E5_ASCIM|nr:hypothetical protein BJ508DRAFT_362084 [Ascobolus immersus RN42]
MAETPHFCLYSVNVEAHHTDDYHDSPFFSEVVEHYVNLEQANASARQCVLFGGLAQGFIAPAANISNGERDTFECGQDVDYLYHNRCTITETDVRYDKHGCIDYTAWIEDNDDDRCWRGQEMRPREVHAWVKRVYSFDAVKPMTPETLNNWNRFMPGWIQKPASISKKRKASEVLPTTTKRPCSDSLLLAQHPYVEGSSTTTTDLAVAVPAMPGAPLPRPSIIPVSVPTNTESQKRVTDLEQRLEQALQEKAKMRKEMKVIIAKNVDSRLQKERLKWEKEATANSVIALPSDPNPKVSLRMPLAHSMQMSSNNSKKVPTYPRKGDHGRVLRYSSLAPICASTVSKIAPRSSQDGDYPEPGRCNSMSRSEKKSAASSSTPPQQVASDGATSVYTDYQTSPPQLGAEPTAQIIPTQEETPSSNLTVTRASSNSNQNPAKRALQTVLSLLKDHEMEFKELLEDDDAGRGKELSEQLREIEIKTRDVTANMESLKEGQAQLERERENVEKCKKDYEALSKELRKGEDKLRVEKEAFEKQILLLKRREKDAYLGVHEALMKLRPVKTKVKREE